MKRAWHHIVGALLGPDPLQRRHVGRTLLAASVYLASLGAEALGVFFGISDPGEAAWLAGVMLVGSAAFYALIRSGWSCRLADPSLALPQVVFAIVMLTLSYPVNGAARGLTLLIASLLPVFGFLSIRPRRAIGLTCFSLLMFGSTMLLLAWLQPARFDPRMEAVHFAIAVVCLPSMGFVLAQISRIQVHVRAQKRELESALQRIEAVSTRDELTGLFNRRHMAARLDAEVKRRGRDGAAAGFCVCIIDIDFFKRINDGHGHGRGDAVLRRFAALLQGGVRDAGVLARWGGEEFLLMLPATAPETGAALVEQLRARIAEAALWEEDAPLRVRFSAGLAADAGAPAHEIIDRADRALYRAKAEGRDRLVLD